MEKYKEDVILNKRRRDSHKGDYGRVLVVAGSLGMAGAAILCGKAAIKSGAGLVTFAAPPNIYNILQVSVPEAMCLTREFTKVIDIHKYDTIILGPGIGLHKHNISMIKKILNEYRGNLVIDADGINCIMKYNLFGNLAVTDASVILTPHVGEAKRILQVDEIQDNKAAAIEIAKNLNLTTVLKSHITYIVDEEKVYENTTGNPGMATGGSGDVLAGVIGALLAQGYNNYKAAIIGTYIHGTAGDLAAEKYGEISMTALNILDELPEAIKKIYK